MRWWRRAVLTVALAPLALLLLALPAAAHPLGNFTTNRYARVEIGDAVVRITYVLDEAELVAFRERAAIEADADGFATRRVEEIIRGLRLEVEDQPLKLRPVLHRLTQPAGQGGLTTLRLDAVLEATLPSSSRGGVVEATFDDRNQPDRIGWREVIVRGVAGTRLSSSTVPSQDRSDGLRDYPTDTSVAPLDVRSATFRFWRGSGTDAAASFDAGTGSARSGDRFVRLLDETTSSPVAVVGALLVALAFGAVHAVGPGHGKTVMAAYLVSTRGRRRDAVALGGIVSLMHTASVLALAGVLATVGRDLRAERLYPVLTIVAGVIVLVVGIGLLRRRLPLASRVRSGTHGHDHDHDHAAARVLVPAGAAADADLTGHHHHHGGPGGHTHEPPPDTRPLSRGGLVALATSGGLFPSPSAVVVLVGAFALGRAVLGLALVAAFSIGLAAVLVGVGLALVAGRDRLLASRLAVSLPWLPAAGAGAVTILGIVLVIRGVVTLR